MQYLLSPLTGYSVYTILTRIYISGEGLVRKVILLFFALLLVVTNSFGMADSYDGYDYQKEDLSGYDLQPNLEVNDQAEYMRNGHDLYLFGGYVYTRPLLSDSVRTIADPSSSGDTISYKPSKIVPDSFNGLDIGLGKEVSRHFDLQASYLQYFESKKTSVLDGSNLHYKIKTNAVMGDLAYVINPSSRFQVLCQMGAMLKQTSSMVSGDGSSYYTVSNNTNVDPMLGMEFLMQFTKSIGLRMGVSYVLQMQDDNSHGNLNGLLALNYVV